MINPITPDEVVAARVKQVPDAVMECFNRLIAQKFNGLVAKVIQDDAMAAILATMPDVTRQHVFDQGWLNVEPIYRAAGWKVQYDKPGYNETYSAYFIFTPKPK